MLQNWLSANTRRYFPRVRPPCWHAADGAHRANARRFVLQVLRNEAPEYHGLDREAAEMVLVYYSLNGEPS